LVLRTAVGASVAGELLEEGALGPVAALAERVDGVDLAEEESMYCGRQNQLPFLRSRIGCHQATTATLPGDTGGDLRL
jgi:hypothetical protein